MFIERKGKKRINCTVCKEPIFKDEVRLRCGHKKEHVDYDGNTETIIEYQGPSICMHCLKTAVETTRENKEWPLRGWNFLTKKTHRNFTACSICDEEIHEEDYVWISKYATAFNSSITVIDFTCIHCIEKLIESIPEQDFKNSSVNRFEMNLIK